MRKNKKIYKRLFIEIISIYVVFTLENQQKTLNKYTKLPNIALTDKSINKVL